MSCSTCNSSKSPLVCGLCQAELCKSCTEFIDEERFSFLPKVPEHLKHTSYCGPCFSEKVAPEILNYDETMERAKGILVFERTQGKETRLVRRQERPVQVADCKDHDETIMRLAFRAVQANYNAI